MFIANAERNIQNRTIGTIVYEDREIVEFFTIESKILLHKAVIQLLMCFNAGSFARVSFCICFAKLEMLTI